MFRSTHLLWYFVSKGGFIFRFIDTLLSIKPAYLVCISQHAVNINNIRWVLCWNTTSTKTSAVFPSQPSCNISTVLCRAVSGMPPAQWRGVGIHQHTGKWEWGLNNRALSHCHSARYVGRHCLESALLVSGTKNKRRKEKKKKTLFRFMALLRRLHLTPSLKKIQQHETSFRFGSSCQRCNPYSLHYGTSNMIQLTTSVELTSWPTRISAKKNLWKLEFQCKGQEAKNSFLFFQALTCSEQQII